MILIISVLILGLQAKKRMLYYVNFLLYFTSFLSRAFLRRFRGLNLVIDFYWFSIDRNFARSAVIRRFDLTNFSLCAQKSYYKLHTVKSLSRFSLERC